jgi:glycosyltransferase involved in cell wall biosynthesis
LIGIKTIWTVHEWEHKADGDITPLQSAIVGNCFHAIITHCEATKRQIQSYFLLEKKNKVFVIPHGNYLGVIANAISQQDAREELGLPQDGMVFLIFGHLYPFKGHLEAIEAFQKLEHDRSYLLIVGSAANVQFKEKIEKKIQGYENILLIPERVPDERVQVYMNACDCVVLPYKIFTTSGIALIAMSFKRACIAPNKDFFRDIVSDSGGFLYDSAQEDGLLQSMNFALKNRGQLVEMGQHNYNRSKDWDWDTIAEKTFQVYLQ